MVRKYIHDGSGGGAPPCSPSAEFDRLALLTQLNTQTMQRSVPGSTTEISYSWTTAVGEPLNSAWPLGDYTIQVRVNTFQITSFTLALLRVNSGCTIQETLGTSSALSGTGNKSFTVNTTPSSGAGTDLYQSRVVSTNDNTMPKNIALRVDQLSPDDSFQLGPWIAPIGAAGMTLGMINRGRRRRRT